MSDDDQDKPPQTPEERERAERLFAKLAAEEPPLDLDSDTAPSKTAPRGAVLTQDTRPVRAINSGRWYLVTLVIGVLLMVGLIITLMLFLNTDDNQPDNEAAFPPQIATTNIAEVDSEDASLTETRQPPTPVPTESIATPILPTPSPTEKPNEPIATHVPPPTAAADVQGAWLLTPIAPVDLTVSSINRQDSAFTIAGDPGRLEVIPYRVVQGDTLSGIAARYNLDVCTLVWSNPNNKVSPLRPGNTLDILPVDGVFYRVERKTSIRQIAEATAVDAYDIIDSPYNDLFGATPDSVLVEGMKIVVPGGNGGSCNVWAAPGSSGNGVSAGGIGGGSLWGCEYTVENGGFAGITPVSGRYEFFQGFSAAHSGVDLSASPGTPVVAAGGGAVAFAGWNEYGYGNAIVIDHGGIYTLYGHLSSINVSCGQNVAAGDVIGGVGSTGRSSGPHLHFEIRDAGFNPVDPTYSIRL
jgi:murein DD-endopeptidase MepM/ murein hydrolase activator NlpD